MIAASLAFLSENLSPLAFEVYCQTECIIYIFSDGSYFLLFGAEQDAYGPYTLSDLDFHLCDMGDSLSISIS